jgi:transposase
LHSVQDNAWLPPIMSLPEFSTQSNLFSTAALSTSLFPEDDRYRLFARLVYPRLVQVRPQMADCYCAGNGRMAVEPVLLLGISMLQFVDGLPDRAAVEMLKYHAGWNFALNRQLGDSLFHSTTLVNFRQRIIDHDLSPLVFQTILDGLVDAGLVQRQSRQRLDSTQIFGRVSRMSRLECMRETLRLAIEELEATTTGMAKPECWLVLRERYVENKLDFRADSTVLTQKMNLAGADAAQLLAWVRQLPDSAPGEGAQLKLLQRAWDEDFELVSNELQQRQPHPAGALQNPHDPDAQWAAKGHGKHRKEHVGYKVQVAETVSESKVPQGEPTPNFITAVVIQPAIGSDDAGLPLVEEEQAQMGLEKPKEWYFDGAYMSAERLAQAQAQGRELIGPAQSPPTKDGRFSVDDFDVCVQERKAICPAGKTSTNCSRLEAEETRKVNYRFEFPTHCHECTLRDKCLGKGQRFRTIVVGQYHTVLQARRKEQKTETFKLKAQRRNAIEGTQSELVRGHGLRQARYRGLAKMRLQSYLTGAACNLKRWIRLAAWKLAQASAILSSEAVKPVTA